jgi:hypothetical protein
MSSERLKTSEYIVFGSISKRININWENVEYVTELLEVKKGSHVSTNPVGTTIHFVSGQMISVADEYQLVKHEMLCVKG